MNTTPKDTDTANKVISHDGWEDEEVLPLWMDDDLYMYNQDEADDYRDEGY